MRKPRALAAGDRVAIVAPASPFAPRSSTPGCRRAARARLRAGLRETRLRARRLYRRHRRQVRAAALRTRLGGPVESPRIVAARGGYGSVQLLPLLEPSDFADPPKAFIGYSDNTSLLTWLTLTCGIVTFHGPMIEGRLRAARPGYDRDTFERCLCAPGAGRPDHASAARGDPRGGSGRHADRRHADAAGCVARDAVRVRSAAWMRAVPRRSRRAAVPDRSHVHAAARRPASSAARRRSSSASCRAATSRPATLRIRDVVGRPDRATSPGRCCSACPRGTRRRRR